MKKILVNLLFLFTGCNFLFAKASVEAHMLGQLGNNLFIVATAQALAWDHDAEAYFPELQFNCAGGTKNLILNLTHIFHRCNLSESPTGMKKYWHEPSLTYHKIPFQDGIKLLGYFQSEKYFAHHREKILELFAPLPEDLKYIETKYKWLLDHPNTVSIQLRKYHEDPEGKAFLQYGKDYLRKAMKTFPKGALFIVFSNDMDFARNNIPEEFKSQVQFIENEEHHIDLYLASRCKHNIISNSSFGWWGAWLNQNPNKIVTVPKQYYNPLANRPTQDYYPETWIQIDAKGGALSDPSTYQ